ncbi:MAG: hypothetical protein AAF628_22660 [Planctomycetota bacterium]
MRLPATLPSLLGVVATLATGLHAQNYDRTILVTGLSTPTGIAVHNGSGDLYFTELPEPGVFSRNNTVSMYDASSSTVSAIVRGEPGPTNIVVDDARSIYWTCKAVGPVMRLRGGVMTQVARGDNPTGIAMSPAGRLYITEVPTPGVFGTSGGRNRVAEIGSGGSINTVVAGEPEPVDVVVDANENLYWTCQTVGVILKREASTGNVSMVLNGLEQPVGLAMDDAGNLYFSEIPTPGVFGTAGGRNKVWKYDPSTGGLTLINCGDPEPRDVAVTADGSSVYWTCSTAGVIVRANRIGPAPTVTARGPLMVGGRTDLDLSAPGSAGDTYFALTSMSIGAVPLPGGDFLPIAWDGLLQVTATMSATGVFQNYTGTLDGSGQASAAIQLPGFPALQGLRFNTAFLVFGGTTLNDVSDALTQQVR